MKKILLFLALIELTSCAYDDTEPIRYFPKVKAVIADNCMRCHSESGPWYGRPVAFDTDQEIVSRANEIKDAVVSKVMPKGRTLSQSDIDAIVAWVNAGGKANN